MNAIAHRDETQASALLPADPMVSMIERLVLNPDADLDKLERMLALKRDHDRDNARIAFAAALAASRAKIPPIVKDATVDFSSSKGRTHYRHETLAGIAKAIDPILSECGLSYRFRTAQEGGSVRVTCIIAHAHGHSEETSLACAPDGSGSKNAFQAVGSAVTYLQRYTLKAALGLAAELDDDGQSATPRPDEARAYRAPVETITQEQFLALRAKAEEAGVSEDAITQRAGVEHLHDLPAGGFAGLMRKLQSTINARQPAAIDASEIPY